jgi:hypothetical protein
LLNCGNATKFRKSALTSVRLRSFSASDFRLVVQNRVQRGTAEFKVAVVIDNALKEAPADTMRENIGRSFLLTGRATVPITL